MALDKVVADILASARKDADQMISVAEKERASILESSQKAADEKSPGTSQRRAGIAGGRVH